MRTFILFILILNIYIFKIIAQNNVNFKYISKFNYPNFSSQQDLFLEDKAKKTNQNNICLTESDLGQRGALWYQKEKINIKDGFSTQFSFKISQNGISWIDATPAGADGIAFVIHGNQTPNNNGGSGGGIGYEGIKNSVVIEFDTWDNDEGSNNHISIQTKGNAPNSPALDASVAINKNLPISLKNGQIHQVWIEYKNEILAIYLNKVKIIEKPINLLKIIDIPDTKAWVGFTASTGAAYSKQEILSWQLDELQKEEPKKEIKKEEVKKEEPKTLENRKVTVKQKIQVTNQKVVLEVWDRGVEDGDIISLNFNGQWVLENYTLTQKKKTIEVTLNENENWLILHAINLGTRPPNTVAVSIRDGKKNRQTLMSSSLNASDSIEINYKPKK